MPVEISAFITCLNLCLGYRSHRIGKSTSKQLRAKTAFPMNTKETLVVYLRSVIFFFVSYHFVVTEKRHAAGEPTKIKSNRVMCLKKPPEPHVGDAGKHRKDGLNRV